MGFRWIVVALVWGSFAIAQRNCAQRVAGPAAPEAPEVEPAPLIPEPLPKPAPAREPQRFMPFPDSNPDKPLKTVPGFPVVDPKNVSPTRLYGPYANPDLKDFWKSLPEKLANAIDDEMAEEFAQLSSHMRKTYPRLSHTSMDGFSQEGTKLFEEIRLIEKRHTPELLAIVRKMVDERFGVLAGSLKISINQKLPADPRHDRQKPSKKGLEKVPQLPSDWVQPLVYRTELHNIWQQGEGWLGATEFAFRYEDDLSDVHPDLPDLYREYDRLYRFLNALFWEPTTKSGGSAQSGTQATGREIVEIQFRRIEQDGVWGAELESVDGTAVGWNAWLAAHEARKAAAQMATPHEAFHRWMLSLKQRKQLDAATNDDFSEFRQAVLGPPFVKVLRRRFNEVYAPGRLMTEAEYYQRVDDLFSLDPKEFWVEIHRLWPDE